MSIRTIYNKLKKAGELSSFQHATTQELINKTIRKFIQDKRLIIHGSRAVNAQTHFPYQRAARDYDVFTKRNSRLTADQLDKLLDKVRKGDYHYVKPSAHRGTNMVMDVGADLKKRTRDDFELASITQIPRKRFSTVEINSILYAHLDELEKAKLRTLRYKKYTFRHKKDREDLRIIQKLKGGLFWIWTKKDRA